jgi:hypothetical protein
MACMTEMANVASQVGRPPRPNATAGPTFDPIRGIAFANPPRTPAAAWSQGSVEHSAPGAKACMTEMANVASQVGRPPRPNVTMGGQTRSHTRYRLRKPASHPRCGASGGRPSSHVPGGAGQLMARALLRDRRRRSRRGGGKRVASGPRTEQVHAWCKALRCKALASSKASLALWP